MSSPVSFHIIFCIVICHLFHFLCHHRYFSILHLIPSVLLYHGLYCFTSFPVLNNDDDDDDDDNNNSKNSSNEDCISKALFLRNTCSNALNKCKCNANL